MDIKSALRCVVAGKNLSFAAMSKVMQNIMNGEATEAQIGGFLVGLAMKGESVTEITAAATVMRSLVTRVEVAGTHLVDTCGTGGDGSASFNISTASAFVVAAAGAQVAKHGNRSLSGQSGSADMLEAAGVPLDLSPSQISHCIATAGIGFMFAPLHHNAMKYAVGPRREMAIRTIFNLLGPLTNPAATPHQVIGVFDTKWVEPLAKVMGKLGAKQVIVVHAEDGMDEISTACATQVSELSHGKIENYALTPEQFGIERRSMESTKIASPAESLALTMAVFRGQKGVARDAVRLNAGAAIYAAGLVSSLSEGVELATVNIDNGGALRSFDRLVEFSQQLAHEC